MRAVLEFDFIYPWTNVQKNKLVPLDENSVDEIVIHHTDSGDVSILSDDIHHELVEVMMDAQEIGRWHEDRDFIGPGYHILIRQNGNKEQGRPLSVKGAHASGHNGRSWGVAIACNCTKQRPTAEQFQGLVETVVALKAKRPTAVIKMHRDVCPTDCPGQLFPWDEFIIAVEQACVAPWMPQPVKIQIGSTTFEGFLLDGMVYSPIRTTIEAITKADFLQKKWDNFLKINWDQEKKVVEVI
jgi:hypothetical protein